MACRIVYTDLDGTMVGPGGCFFRREDSSVDLEPAAALGELLASGVPLVLVSGRTRPQLLEACAVFGADGFIAELGALIGWHSHVTGGGVETELLRGAMPAEFDSPPDTLVEALLERFAGRLEFHTPWHLGHEVDVMLRGQVDGDEVQGWLAAAGFDWLRLRDNGVLPPRPTTLDVAALHVYHLVPDGVSKGLAVARDLQRRGIACSDAIAIGDSASDLAMAPVVGQFSLVANGARPPHMGALLARHDNVVVEDGSHGAGWAAAVRRGLAG